MLSIIWIAKWRNWHEQAFCKCDCWNTKIVDIYHLKNWTTKSCWCILKKNIEIWSNIWNFILKKELYWYKRRTILCECIFCWKQVTIRMDLIKHKKSCWCLKNKWSKTHWLSTHKMYRIWRWIQSRCNYKWDNYYHRYWGRWIKCEWNNFEEFYNDMYWTFKEWLSIDRINNDWNYCKENCKWSTPYEQAQNRNNCIIEWWLLKYCRENNIDYIKVRNRIKVKWMTFEQAIIF